MINIHRAWGKERKEREMGDNQGIYHRRKVSYAM